MRPELLELSAFGPFKCKTVIDFSAFHGQIFLLTGETGSGKTSIFDAISFALFGEASGGRERRSGKSFRSDYADPETPTYVTLTFTEAGRRHTVTRSPEYERAKKRGVGTTVVPSTASLVTEGEERVITRIDEVDARIVEIIGLDRRQFSRTVMIAQGDFLRILNAGSDERKAMFQNLFHTEIYARAEEMLRERTRVCRAKREELSTRARAVSQQASCLPDFDRADTFARAKEKVAEHPEAFLAVLEEYDRLLEERLGIERERERVAREEAEGLSLALQRAEDQSRLLGERDALLALQTTPEEERRIAAESEAIALAQSALRVRPFARVLQLRENEETAVEQALQLLQEREKKDTVAADLAKEALKAAQDEAKALPALEADVRRLKTAAEAVKVYQSALQAAQRAAEALAVENQLCREAEGAHSLLREAFWLGQAGLLAEALQEGTPCPVCGSLSHPAPAARPQNTPERKEVEAAEQRERQMRERFHLAGVRFEKAQTAVEAAGKALEDCGVDTKAREADLLALSLEQEGLSKRIGKALEEAVENERRTEERRIATVSGLSEKRKQSLVASAEAKKARADFAAACQAGGFADEQAYLAAVCDESVLRSREAALRQALERREERRGRLAQLEALLSEQKPLDLAVLTAQKNAALEALEAFSEQTRRLDRTLTVNCAALRDLRAVCTEKRKNEEQWTLLEDLYRTVGGTGSAGRAKLSLEGYVQRYYFREVIAAANRRLQVLTDGNFVLRCRELAKDLRSRADLDLEVLDRSTGLWRDVSTLSGGESFMASLALAVGLSDVVQNRSSRVRLDMLFIDEGFGTLDEGTLQRAMELLRRLSDGSRTIGVISHVAELRERIEKKLILTHTPNGSVVRTE